MRVTLIALCVAAGIVPAFAHAKLGLSRPADGAELSASPKELVLTFNEPVAPVFIKVLAPGGAEMKGVGEAERDGKTLRAPLAEALTPGTYTVSYRVVADDTHPVSGAFKFTVKATGTP